MPKNMLDPEEKKFFRTVYNAAFANPFSELREKLDRKIAGMIPGTDSREATDMCIREVNQRLKKLQALGKGNINEYSREDREILRVVYLFDIFHKFRDEFDQLIKDQIKAGDAPVKVEFAEQARQMVVDKGFSDHRFWHYFALSFQLRRAFYFISQTLVGTSPCMKKLKKHLWYNVFTYNMDLYDQYLWNRMEDFSTLLLGETGTGKGTAAKAIGQSGFIPFDEKKNCFTQSFTRAFSSLNLSQYPETLLESELFGHTKGAFTGAVEDYQGVFALCSPHGSILLDEIGEIPNHVQIKLLRVLQERNFSPVGSHASFRFNGRVIAATNRPRKDIMSGKVFRDDFYYRLCSDIIEVPPLRTRIREKASELDDLLSFTIHRMTGMRSKKLLNKVKRIIDRGLGKDYQWPGNVRELEQCVRSVLLRRDYKGKEDAAEQDASPALTLARRVSDQSIAVPELVAGYCRLLYDTLGTYEKVARATGLDRRTVKKHITRN
ncbi:sigma 54-interacting transcriptional regulator [Desulfospira joergensenii]|uniref:sigma 54-interacting transcriptional regulator n=1 Tax=Desulfospira joergensenii TaxID=53329 RepID=UPI00040931FD|nr:sigma 54-interacting transcriptional regulator [Desulfospira joergensenii]